MRKINDINDNEKREELVRLYSDLHHVCAAGKNLLMEEIEDGVILIVSKHYYASATLLFPKEKKATILYGLFQSAKRRKTEWNLSLVDEAERWQVERLSEGNWEIMGYDDIFKVYRSIIINPNKARTIMADSQYKKLSFEREEELQ